MKVTLLFFMAVAACMFPTQAQNRNIFTKKDGDLKYSLELKSDSTFIFESSVSTHGEVIFAYETGIYQAKGEAMYLIVIKSGPGLDNLAMVTTQDTLRVTRTRRNRLLLFGNGGTSITLTK